VRETIVALADAGCPFIQIDEDAAVGIGDDPAERRVFREAQRRVTEGITGTHLSLAIRGGSADGAGSETIFDAPYASYLFDLVAGPDNWRLVTRAPGDRGIVCGVADARSATVDALEIMVWAAHYAASTGGRGLQRVGLATTGSMAGLPWPTAVAKMDALADAAGVAASSSADEIASILDPRAVDKRSAALGRYAPPRKPAG
jgi:methionine synthase II (cobalamin-independent)